FLTKALSKNPGGGTGIAVHNLMGEALIEAGRESDSRIYLEEALKEHPENGESLQILAESFVHGPFRKYLQAYKPLTAETSADLCGSIEEELGNLEKLPASARNEVAEAELHHLCYTIRSERKKRAEAALNAAETSRDSAALSNAQKELATLKEPVSAEEEESLALLRSALEREPKNARGASLLAQYEYEDRHYPEALAVYEQRKRVGDCPQELVLTTANVLIADSVRQPDHDRRIADAQKVLEAYLADHPKDARILVALGQVMLEQNLIADANKKADRANAEAPGDLDAQILLINCRLREKKTADALALITPLTNAHSNVPQIWYLLGLADSDSGDFRGAEDAFRKSLALNPGFLPARRSLLSNEIRSGNNAAAVLLASEVLRDDRYYMPAWSVTVESLQKQGQADRARALLTNLANDPEFPKENKADLVRMLVEAGAACVAEQVLATLPANENAMLQLKASVAAAAGDDANARELMVKALAGDPTNAELRLQYAAMLLNANLRADARAQFDQLSKEKLTADESLQLARGYLALRLPEESAAITTQLLAEQSKNVEALSLNERAEQMQSGGLAAKGGGDWNSATQPSSLANVGTDQATVGDTVRLGLAALDQKNYTQALSLARAGIARDGANAGLHQIAARALAGLGQYDQAVEEVAAAANTQPDSTSSFSVFVGLFPTADEAAKGLAYAGRLLSINPALGDWAMGRLAETSGQADLALRYYNDGINSANRTTDPTAAKEVLYGAVLTLHAARKDAAAIKKAAEQFAGDSTFAVSARLAATSSLLAVGDRAGAEEELGRATDVLNDGNAPARVALAVAQSWMTLGNTDRAEALIQKQVEGGNKDPELLATYAGLLRRTDPTKALGIVQELVKQDPSNPQFRVMLAEAQATCGEDAAAFRTLDDAGSMGETGRQLATAGRLRLLISLGLLNAAADELSTHQTATTPPPSPVPQDDYASMLAIGQAWAEVHRPGEARKSLAAIPTYAAEYGAAQVSLASLDVDEGRADAAVKTLEKLQAVWPNAAAIPLYRAYVRVGAPQAALELARSLRNLAPVNSAPWRTATLYAAAAAREGRQYGDAVDLLNSLDDAARKGAALDLSLLQILEGKGEDAVKSAANLSDAAPAYNRRTLQILAAGGRAGDRLLSEGMPSTVYAALAAMTPAERRAGMAPPHPLAVKRNPNVLAGDVANVLAEVGEGVESSGKLQQLALAARLNEAGWSTSALEVLDRLDKETGDRVLTGSLVERVRALEAMKREEEAKRVLGELASRVDSPNAGPTVRVVLAEAAAKEERYADALKLLEPLAGLNRPGILTTIATMQEKLGRLDEAIAIHRQIRKLDPGNVLAANNLAYTLAAARPEDKAALSEARKEIQFAIDQTSGGGRVIPAFQDTLGWIEILSGEAAEGTQRIARVMPALRLDPAVHYHLGMGYAKIGQGEMARLHLQDVQFLAPAKQAIPELPMATAALKSLSTASEN
ncbi:MAG TPA: tetratricopeptide repeat protein, partial [Phycisphaerae bacterium]|nr:tetratricopeptide repeat protein [Phycisphaerae bacterium]